MKSHGELEWEGSFSLREKKPQLGLASVSNNWFQNLGSFKREWDR